MKLRYVSAPDDALRRTLSKATSLGEAVTVLRVAAGSHDKLAAALGTSRQRVIAWESGAYPRAFVSQLRDLGVPDRLLDRLSRIEVEKRLRQVEADVAEIRRLFE